MAMDQDFLDELANAVELAHRSSLLLLGRCGLVPRVRKLLEKRMVSEKKDAAISVGAALRNLIGETIKEMLPQGQENLDQVAWRRYIFLYEYVILGASVTNMDAMGRLGLKKASIFELKEPAIGDLALLLWKREDEIEAHPVKHNLPRPFYTEFVRRVDEQGRDCVERIIELLRTHGAWVIAISGIPGIGKTTVALEMAQRCRERELFEAIVWTSAQYLAFYPPDRVLQISEHVLSLDNILNTIGNTLEKRAIRDAPGLAAKLDAVTEELKKTNCLLIIDNLEALSKKTQDEIYTFLLQDLPQTCKALVIGRESSYPGQTFMTIPQMRLSEALAFMQQQATLRDLEPLTAVEAEQIYLKTQGVPLAMQTAIGLIRRGFGIDQVTTYGPPYDTMLDFMYEEAYRRLSIDEKKILHVLPIFRESALPEALAHASSVWDDALRDSLGKLYQGFLVQKVADTGRDRYYILPMTREFLGLIQRPANNMIDGEALDDFLIQARENLVKYYLEALNKMTVAQQLGLLKYEKETIYDLMGWCEDTQHYQLLVDLMLVMGWPLSILGRWNDRMTWGQKAIEASQALNQPGRALWFQVHDLAWAYIRTGRVDEGTQIIRDALLVAQAEHYREVEALALRNLGRLAGERHDIAEGISYLEQSLALWESLGDSGWLARTLGALGWLRYQNREWLLAREYLEKALQLYRQVGYLDGEISALADLALVMAELGDPLKAVALSDEALARAETVEKPAPPYAYTLWLRAQLWEKLGYAWAQIVPLLNQAIQTYENAGARYWALQVKKWLEEHHKP